MTTEVSLESVMKKIDCEDLLDFVGKKVTTKQARFAQVKLRVKKCSLLHNASCREEMLDQNEVRIFTTFQRVFDDVVWAKGTPEGDKYRELHLIGAKKSFVGRHNAAIDIYLVKHTDKTVSINYKTYNFSGWFPKYSLGSLDIKGDKAIPIFDLDFNLFRFDFYSSIVKMPMHEGAHGWFGSRHAKFALRDERVFSRDHMFFVDKSNMPHKWRLDFVVNKINGNRVYVQPTSNGRRYFALNNLFEYAKDKYSIKADLPKWTTITK